MTAPALATAAADAATGPVRITTPGIYELSNSEYHSQTHALSSSGARLLTKPAGAALFHHERTNPRPPKDVFDFGSAAHTVVLGRGDELAIIDAPDWKTNAAQDARKQARAEGKIPILAHNYLIVEAMAAAIRRHEFAATLLAASKGHPERCLFWQDGSLMRRAMIDWLREPNPDRRTIAVDYKSTTNASDEAFSSDMNKYGYHQQADWYRDAIIALGLDGNGEPPVFLFIAQEKTAPYLVNVIQPTEDALKIGRHLNRQAINLYKECTASGVWPGYGNEVHAVSVPAYIERQYEKEPWFA